MCEEPHGISVSIMNVLSILIVWCIHVFVKSERGIFLKCKVWRSCLDYECFCTAPSKKWAIKTEKHSQMFIWLHDANRTLSVISFRLFSTSFDGVKWVFFGICECVESKTFDIQELLLCQVPPLG